MKFFIGLVLRDERAAIPMGSYQGASGVTFSLPSVVGRVGVVSVSRPELTNEERKALANGRSTPVTNAVGYCQDEQFPGVPGDSRC
jgi:malate/lactate dehydrogenase